MATETEWLAGNLLADYPLEDHSGDTSGMVQFLADARLILPTITTTLPCTRAALLQAFGTTPSDPGWNPAADLNNDSIIDEDDLALHQQMSGPRRVHISFLNVSEVIGDDFPYVASVTLKDDLGATIFDSSVDDYDFYATQLTSTYVVLRWSFAAPGETERCYSILLIGRSQLSLFSWPMISSTAYLSPRAVTFPTGLVRHVIVGDDELDGEIELLAGYNATLTSQAAGASQRTLADELSNAAPPALVRPSARVDMNAGGGIGRYPECGEAILRSINGVSPNDSGELHLTGDPCYWLDTPGNLSGGSFTPLPARIKLRSGCGVCCQCSDYYALYDRLAQAWNTHYLPMIERLEDIWYAYLDVKAAFSQFCSGGEVGGGNFLCNFKLFPHPGWTAGLVCSWRNGTRYTPTGTITPWPAGISEWRDTRGGYYHGVNLQLHMGVPTPSGAEIALAQNEGRIVLANAMATRQRSWNPRGEMLEIQLTELDVTDPSKWSPLNPELLQAGVVYWNAAQRRFAYTSEVPLPPNEYEVLQLSFYCADYVPDHEKYGGEYPTYGWRRLNSETPLVYAPSGELGEWFWRLFAFGHEYDPLHRPGGMASGFNTENDGIREESGAPLEWRWWECIKRTLIDQCELLPPLNRTDA